MNDSQASAPIPWNRSPASIAAASIAAMQLLATLVFVPVYLSTPVNGPSGGDKIGMFGSFAFLSCAFVISGVITSLFAPGWRRKVILLATNLAAAFASCAGLVVADMPPADRGNLGPIVWEATRALLQGW